jgi:hypothetical protein
MGCFLSKPVDTREKCNKIPAKEEDVRGQIKL